MMHEDRMFFQAAAPDEPFFLNYIGHSYCDGTYRLTRTRANSNFYVFEYIISGRGFLQVEDQTFYPEAGDVYIIPAFSDHEYASSAEDPWVKVFFNAGGPFIRQALENYQLANTVLFKKMPRNILELFEDGIRKIFSQPTKALKTAPLVLLEIILELSENTQNRKKNYSGEGIQIRHILDENVYQPAITLNEICQKIKISPSQVIRIFRRDFGVTPYHYLLERKMELAKLMLKSTSSPIKRIALELGFSDVYYFSNIFKKKSGISPRYFRRNAMEQEKECLFTTIFSPVSHNEFPNGWDAKKFPGPDVK